MEKLHKSITECRSTGSPVCYHLTCGHHVVAPDSDERGEAMATYCPDCGVIISIIGWTSRIFTW